jgi:hypothetical protein
MRRVVPLLAVAALLAAAAPAIAGPREDARRFSDAALRAKAMIATHAGEVEEATAALRPCFELAMRAPAHASDRASSVLAVEVVYELLHPAEPVLRRFVADLEAVATTDPALRAGRMAWRRALAIFAALPHAGDPCVLLERWRAAGWSADAAPPDLAPAFDRLERLNGGRVVDRWMRSAVHRLRELGVSKRAARRFAGDGMFDALIAHALTLIEPAEPL